MSHFLGYQTLAFQRKPIILRGQDIGGVTNKWSAVDYLAERGGAKPVKIHVSPVPQMDFINKNFAYKYITMLFNY